MTQHELVVTSGRGPVEARRFVVLLADRLVAVCAERGLAVVSTATQGPSATPFSVALRVSESPAELVRTEVGTHALVSADRGRRSRKRWYAGVYAFDRDELTLAPSIDPQDLEISFCRSGGPGGQHVNKAATAVIARHRPTNIRVRVDAQRSQRDNRRAAERRILEKLHAHQADIAAEQRGAARLAHHHLCRGNPVRVYRLDFRNRLELLDAP